MATVTIDAGSVPVYRGAWASGVSVYKANVFLHNNAYWYANSDGLTNAPSSIVSGQLVPNTGWTQGPSGYEASKTANEAADAANAAADRCDHKADIDGYYETLGAGTATNLKGSDEVPAEFTRRTSGGTADIGSGAATLARVKGNTIVWNQFVNAESPGTTAKDTEVTTENKYVETSTTTSPNRMVNWGTAATIPVGHKVLIMLIVKSDYDNAPYFRYQTTESVYENINITNYTVNTWTVTCSIVTGGLFAGSSNGIIPDGNSHVQGKYISTPLSGGLKVFDLTKMFGAGNEPETVAEFLSLFPLFGYTYNIGSLLNLNATSLVTDGFNQWNEEWELGTWGPDGSKSLSSTTIRCKNKIPVFPSTNYYIKCGNGYSNGLMIGIFYKNGSFRRISGGKKNTIYTTPSDAEYMVFNTFSSENITTYNDDICINLSWSGYRNGEYEQAWQSSLALNIPTITGKLDGEGSSVTIFSDGMKSAGTAYDELVVDTDGVVRKAIKRIASVDMGTLTYTYDSTNARFNANVSGAKLVTGGCEAVSVIYANYRGAIGNMENMMMTVGNSSVSSSSEIFLKNETYTDASTLATAMSGVYLYYELATPLEYVLDTPINVQYRVDDFGTESILPENTATPTTSPFKADIKYSLNARDAIRNLPKNFISKESMQNFLTALGTQMGGTWSMTYNSTTDKFDFTYTPASNQE